MESKGADYRGPGVGIGTCLLATAAVAVGWTASAAAAGADLPIGTPGESTFVMTALRTSVFLWSAALLVFGAKMGRAVVATFFVIVGLAIGMFSVAHTSILLALAIAWLVAALGMGLYLLVPRLLMAVLMFWPLPALFIVHRYFSGSFDRDVPLLIALLVAGGVLGAVFPRRSLVFLSTAIGTALFLWAGPITASFPMVVLIAAAAVSWQALGLGAWRGPARDPRLAGVARRLPRFISWLGVTRWIAGALTAALVLIAWFAPAYDAVSVPESGRLARLAADGELSRPGLVVGPLNNLYLSKASVGLAIVSESGGALPRLTFPLVGRLLLGQVRRMRVVKDELEIEEMRQAAAITSMAFEDIYDVIRPGLTESDIEQLILDSFSRNGATGVAFPCIVGSGANAVLPHYMSNDAELAEGFVVIDIGSSVNGYASDMTRTFSVTGTYTEAQRELIETVIEAGDAARAALRPGATVRQIDAASRTVIDGAGFGRFYTHSVGHHVGLDVHDPGRSPLEPGMVLTIEPGIYIPGGADTDPSYWNLGVRIEDTYVVTEDGWEEITRYPRRPY